MDHASNYVAGVPKRTVSTRHKTPEQIEKLNKFDEDIATRTKEVSELR